MAQNNNQNPPKVGVVLSGGGAKGLAHIGVLKVIDSLGVKVDYIAGSSMGAIIGGLYASGYNAQQLDSIFHTIDFERIIQDKLPRSSKTFYEKDDAAKYALTLPVVNGKISLPKGISNGQNFYNFYSKLTTHVCRIEDFSKLPIPFFCTATNLETGERIIFDKGMLPEAVSASSALPSVYSPIIYDNQLVTDGGVADNYPVEEMRKRGIDFIIGVDVQDDLLTGDELNSVTDIMLQVTNFRTVAAMADKAKLTDIYIKPNIKRFSVVGFSEGEEIIKEGKKTALSHVNTLQEIANRNGRKKGQQKAQSVFEIPIQKVKVENNENYSDNYIKGKIGVKDSVNLKLTKLNKGLDDLYATKNFHSIRYQIKEENAGNTLMLHVNESKVKSFFRFGLHYDNLYKSAAIVNFTRKKLLFQDDKFSFDGIIGDFPRYNFEYYIDKGNYWNFGLSNYFYTFDIAFDFQTARLRRNLADLPISTIDIEYKDITTQLYLETLLHETFAFKIGLEHKWLSVESETLNVDEDDLPGTVFESVNFIGLFSNLKYDTLDDTYFPSSGILFDAHFDAYPIVVITKPLEELDQFAVLKANFKYVKSFTSKISLETELAFGSRLGHSEGISALDFFIGGFGSKTINNQIPFYGRDFYELSGDSYVKSAFTADYNFWKNHHFNFTANYANIGSRIFNIEDWFQRVGFSGYAVGYGYESIIGPLQVKYTFSPDPRTQDVIFISAGYWF